MMYKSIMISFLLLIEIAGKCLAFDGDLHFKDFPVEIIKGTQSKNLAILDFKIGMTLNEIEEKIRVWNRPVIVTGTNDYFFKKESKNWRTSTDIFTAQINVTYKISDVHEDITFYFTSPLTGSRLYAIREVKRMPEGRNPSMPLAITAMKDKWGDMFKVSPPQMMQNYISWYYDNKGINIPDALRCFSMYDKFSSLSGWNINVSFELSNEYQKMNCGAAIVAAVYANQDGKDNTQKTIRYMDVIAYDNVLRFEAISAELALFQKKEAIFSPKPPPPPVSPKF